ncbi:MAG: ligase-associated DNA damage response DEXH box helicase [Pirellula sp.]
MPKPSQYPAMARLREWMSSRGQAPFDWQCRAWNAHWSGANGLLLAGTGMGKTKGAWLGPLGDWLHRPIPETDWTSVGRSPLAPPLLALWVTPLRALANDTTAALQECIDGLQLPWTLQQRTGDTSSHTKLQQRRSPPTAMVITPESLTLMLSYPESRQTFRRLRTVIVDEWHELLGTKRGIQTELALSMLSTIAPEHQRWAISATIGNPEYAIDSLVGVAPSRPVRIIDAKDRKKISLDVLLPTKVERFPWAGHMGLTMLPSVVQKIESARSTLVFTNTRFQTETWYQALLRARPDWAGRIAVHHGSLDSSIREWVEHAVHDGKLIAVVCTSSLDLGVDFAPVDQVIQVGSPKGVARLMQRAGRSGHQPGQESKLVFVPSHALEIVELEAAREAIAERRLEKRQPIEKPLDCLVQHAVTRALAEPYRSEDVLREVRATRAYRDLSDAEWQWVLEFVHTGGSLHAYPDYHRVVMDFGKVAVRDASIARQHRMAIGTIAADLAMHVQFLRGGRIGTVEESFASRLKPGDRFLLGGRMLQMEMIREGTLWVRRAKGAATAVPRWLGGKMPLSSELAEGVRSLLDRYRNGEPPKRSMKAITSLLDLQQRSSHVPSRDELLVEVCTLPEGTSVMLYPMEGRSVSEGLGALLAYRWSQAAGITFSISVNDYGLMLHTTSEFPFAIESLPEWLSIEGLDRDILASLNVTEMTRRRFRDIARIAGLIHAGTPGRSKSMRHLQASAGMVFDALREYDPSHRLLGQASQEVLVDQLEWDRLHAALQRMHRQQWVFRTLRRWSPFSFPLYVERVRDRIGSESLFDRIAKVQSQLEKETVREEGYAADRD